VHLTRDVARAGTGYALSGKHQPQVRALERNEITHKWCGDYLMCVQLHKVGTQLFFPHKFNPYPANVENMVSSEYC